MGWREYVGGPRNCYREVMASRHSLMRVDRAPTLKIRTFANQVPRNAPQLSVLLGLLVAGLALVKYGISMSPGWENLYLVAQEWQQPKSVPALQPPQDYILSNSVLSAFLGAAGITNEVAYVTFQVGLALVAIGAPFIMLSSLRDTSQARLLFLMMAGGPVAAVLITWIGGYDALGVIGATIAALSRSRLVSGLGWFLFALAHGSVALIALGLVFVFRVINTSGDFRFRKAKQVLIPLVAVALGWSAAHLVTLAWGGATSRLEVYLNYPFSYYVNSYISGMPFYLFSILGAGWMIVFAPGLRKMRSTRSLVAIVVGAGLLLPLIALDQTRVTAVVLLPLILTWTRTVAPELGEEGVGTLWRSYGFAAAIIPVLVVWEGSVMMTGWEQVLSWRAFFA